MPLTLRTTPDAVLYTACADAPLGEADAPRALTSLIDSMYALMLAHDGVGLAAPQVGVALRVIVLRPELVGGRHRALINPRVLRREGRQPFTERCLSMPGQVVTTQRPTRVLVEAVDVTGAPIAGEYMGYGAVVVDHELDHLDGKLMTARRLRTGRR